MNDKFLDFALKTFDFDKYYNLIKTTRICRTAERKIRNQYNLF